MFDSKYGQVEFKGPRMVTFPFGGMAELVRFRILEYSGS